MRLFVRRRNTEERLDHLSSRIWHLQEKLAKHTHKDGRVVVCEVLTDD